MAKTVSSAEGEELVDFKVNNEGWNVYELEDGTILKTKLVLINIIRKLGGKEGTPNAGLNTSYVSGVFSPMGKRGPPGRKYTVQELKKNVAEINLKFRQTSDCGWNEYETKDIIFEIRTILKSVDKTSLFDSSGMPSYVVNYESTVMARPKEKKPPSK